MLNGGGNKEISESCQMVIRMYLSEDSNEQQNHKLL